MLKLLIQKRSAHFDFCFALSTLIKEGLDNVR